MRDFARFFKDRFKGYLYTLYDKYHKFPNTFNKEHIVEMMKSDDALRPYSDDEKYLFYVSAIVCNKKLRRNRYVLRTFKSIDEVLSVELVKLL